MCMNNFLVYVQADAKLLILRLESDGTLSDETDHRELFGVLDKSTQHARVLFYAIGWLNLIV